MNTRRARPFQPGRRAQAAIFDGILFLLITALAVSMIFVFVNKYGGEQDGALRSSHMLNYVQSAVKELYYLRADTLTNVARDGYLDANGVRVYDVASNAGARAHPYYGLGGGLHDKGCQYLETFAGPITVADLVKRDLADGSLDNRARAPGTAGVVQPGKLALRCAFKEIMKPFTNAGYRYFVEFIGPNGPNDFTYPSARPSSVSAGGAPLLPDVDQNAFNAGAALDTSVVTDSSLAIGNVVNGAFVPGKPAYRSCEDITAPNTVNPAAQQDRNFVVAVPFRVIDTSQSTTTASVATPYTLQVCLFNA